jgi:hypothetical protein
MQPTFCLKTIFFLFILSLSGCLDVTEESKTGLSDGEYELAVPLINSKITVSKVSEVSKGNTSIRLGNDGKATILYNGEVIRRTAASIFPPFPGVIPYPIEDTLSKIKLQFNNTYLIKKAIFQDTKITFTFKNSLPQNVEIKMRVLELTKDGKTFEKDFSLEYKGTTPATLTTEQISIDGWTLESNDNSMTFQYDAVLPTGEKIKLDFAQMNFDIIKFSYIDGYLGYHKFAVDGSAIDVGLFNKWLSGSFDFEDPKISLSVENAFGLPVRSQVNKMELTSVTGNSVQLESEFITKGIDFAYPLFSEIGQVKTTDFVFDKSNSNIRDVFNEKTKTISYDILALVNPDQDTSSRGFITESSYFVVNVAVEVPFYGSVNQVVVTDTINIDLSGSEEVLSAQFKSISSNDFPADLTLQAYFLDDNGQPIDKLFNADGIVLKAATLLQNGKTTPGGENIDILNFESERVNKIRNSKKLAIVGSINTLGSDMKQSLWIYDSYGIGLKLGAILKYKKI